MEQSVEVIHEDGTKRILRLSEDWNLASVSVRPDVKTGERATYTTEPIKKGALISMWGGSVVDAATFVSLPNPERSYRIQVEENLFLVPYCIPTSPCVSDFTNHSCDPNAGMYGYSALVALRDIDAGEDITMDYATAFVSPFEAFDCLCGTGQCRGRVTGDDWKNPDLWGKFAGYFSPYIQRRIDNLKLHLASGLQ